MINAGRAAARLVVPLLAIVTAGACASSAPQPAESPAATPVPAGCDPARARVEWSPRSTEPILTSATIYRGEELEKSSSGTTILDSPFAPSVTGVAAPASWLPALADSLRKSAGRPVRVTSPSPKSDTFGLSRVSGGDGAEDPPIITYTGVERVKADFQVHCAAAVRGTLLGWSSAVVGGVVCQYEPEMQYDAFGRLALQYCPGPRTPPPSVPAAGAVPR